ncbi:MAG TPA: GAF domain-containing protein [Anaerolineales bacterium]|nr:GAF domain-containing protein [Anaerolineales bacterium]
MDISATPLTELTPEPPQAVAPPPLGALIDIAPQGVFNAQPGGRLTGVNPALARMLGYSSPAELLEQTPDLPHQLYALPDLYARLERDLLHKGSVSGHEAVWRAADERSLWVSVSAAAVRDAEGRLGEIAGVVEDITSRKQIQAQVERHLQESEALAVISQALNETHNLDDILRMIVDAARQIIPKAERAVIHLIDEGGSALRSAAVAGYDKAGRSEIAMRPGEGVAGRVMSEGVPINIGDIRSDPRYLTLGRVPTIRSLLVAPVQSKQRRLGTISVLSDAVEAFRDDDVRLLKAFGIQAALAIENARLLAAESTARQEAEVLGEIGVILSSTLDLEVVLERLLEQIARLVPYDVVRLMLVEHGHARTVQLRGAEYLYASDGEMPRHLVPLEIQRVPMLRDLVATGLPVTVADVYADPDWAPELASALTRSWLGAPIVTSRDGVVAFFTLEKTQPGFYTARDAARVGLFLGPAALAVQNARLYADLGKSLHYEQSMRTRLVQTEKLAAMGRLVASVAHELNNPLQAIQNSLFLVREENTLGPQAREDLQVALTEADRMADLISRLRETYRPASAEQFKFESMNALVEEIHRLIGTHLRHRNIAFAFEPDPTLPRMLVIRDQVKQVLLNLCLNAVEAMPDGGQLRIETGFNVASGEVMTAIGDSGSGINPDDIPSIFDPFFTKKEGGTGLGLFITYEIIQRHSGRVEVESELGRGSTFRVWLPAVGTGRLDRAEGGANQDQLWPDTCMDEQ